jgi:hypothetical protein
MQVPVQEVWQQMPATQCWFAHCELIVQGLPSGAGAQVWVLMSQLWFVQSLFWRQATQLPPTQTLPPPLLQAVPSLSGVRTHIWLVQATVLQGCAWHWLVMVQPTQLPLLSQTWLLLPQLVPAVALTIWTTPPVQTSVLQEPGVGV